MFTWVNRLAILLVLAVLVPAPAQATWHHKSECAKVTGHPMRCYTTTFIGHRAVQEDNDKSRENTLWALRRDRDTGAWCETDTWRLAGPAGPSTGRSVMVHDPTWDRTTSRASMAKAGVAPGTTIGRTTYTQFKQLRSNGGEPYTTLSSWLRHMGKWRVPCLIEVKIRPDLAKVVDWVRRFHAPASFYALPLSSNGGTCVQAAATAMMKAGLKVGLKWNRHCPMTPDQVKSRHYLYVVGPSDIDGATVAAYHDRGLLFYNYNTSIPEMWVHLIKVKVDGIITKRPGKLGRWLNG